MKLGSIVNLVYNHFGQTGGGCGNPMIFEERAAPKEI